MVKIIGISGRKQSGKNTVANYINGSVLKTMSMISDFYLDEEGKLIIETTDESGKNGYGMLDVTRKDHDFVSYAHRELWPYIKTYHFADKLKELSADLFGLNIAQLNGTDKQKNMKCPLSWNDMPTNPDNKAGKMTNREFLEYFGTKIVRQIKSDAWVKATINKIIHEDSRIAIVPDVRFPNEVDVIKDNGGMVIRLTRDIHNSTIDCETALDKDKFDWSKFDLVIDNAECTMPQLCDKLNSISSLWSI
jgi:hypothetical protein